MIWLRIISWVIGRGLLAGAFVGALLGTLIYPIIGTIYGLFVGAILGMIDGTALAVITRVAYSPPDSDSRYPQLVYAVPIFIDVAPIFIIALIGAFTNFSWDNALRIMLIGAIPMTVMGVITAYFTGLFLEFVDLLMAQKASRNTSANMLSLDEN